MHYNEVALRTAVVLIQSEWKEKALKSIKLLELACQD